MKLFCELTRSRSSRGFEEVSVDAETPTNEIESISTDTKKTSPAKCSSANKVPENGNGDVVDAAGETKAALQNGLTDITSQDEEKMNEMFTDDIIDDLKRGLGDNANEVEEEFADETDKEEAAALEVKMKNSEINEAVQLFQQGKRNLIIKDFDSAVETLALACEKYSSIYGDVSAECGEVFMAYGHALIEQWRFEESNRKEDALNDTSKSAPNESIIEPKEVEGEAAPGTNGETEEISQNEEEAAEQEEVKETDENEESNLENGAQPEDENLEENNEEENDDDDDDDDEEVDQLQLAWEIFETAKNIYTKHKNEANLAKVFTKLGEISIASGNYELAIEDLKTSQQILNKLLLAKPRQIADNHFQLYTAYLANFNFDLAEIELRNAKNILEEQLSVLDKKLKDEATESSEVEQIKSEIKDLEELTKDMGIKLSEVTSSKRKVVGDISSTLMNRITNQQPTPSMGEAAGSSGSPSSSSPPKSDFSPSKCSNLPVNNISHLIRKKPKTDSDEEKKVTNGGGPKSNGSATVEVVEAAAVRKTEGQTCKRKADDELEETESNAKKACVTTE